MHKKVKCAFDVDLNGGLEVVIDSAIEDAPEGTFECGPKGAPQDLYKDAEEGLKF